MLGPARSGQVSWPHSSRLRIDVLVVLLASLILALALWLPAAPPPFTRIYRYLHPLETSQIGSYAWSKPDFELHMPLEQSSRQALVRQRMTAGAIPSDARPLRVSVGGTTLEFLLQGGTPLRVYTYLLPVAPSELKAHFSIAPLNHDQPNDQRALGVLLMDTQVRLLGTQLPGAAALALLGVPLTLLGAALGWGMGSLRRPALLLITLIIALFYRADRYGVLPITIAINGGLLMVTAIGYLCRRLTQAPDNSVSSLLLWCLAAVIGPWIYVASELGPNLGRQWIGQPLLARFLLSLPVIAATLYLWRPAPRRMQLALAGLALGGALGWGLFNLRFELSNFATDFSAYYYGAQRALNRQPLYELDHLREGPFAITYKYHPFFLAFVLPLALAPIDTAIMLWRSLGVILLIASAAMIIATQPQALRWRLRLLALVIGTNLAPIGQTLRLGQTDPLILFGIVAALISFRRANWLSACIWGVLGLIKIYPLFLLLPTLLQRAWRQLALVASVVIIGGIASLAFGWENQQIYWRAVVPLLGERNGSLANQSLYGMIVRVLNPEIIRDSQARMATPAANGPFLALAAATFGITLWLILRRRLWQSPWEAASLLICTMLLIMPVSWDQYETLLLLPLLLGAAHTLREPQQPARLLVAAYALLAFGMIKNLWQGTTEPATFWLLFAAYRTLGLALLWGWWAWYGCAATQQEQGAL